MKKLLVPTDFSDTSKNAALFAAQMAADIKNAKESVCPVLIIPPDAKYRAIKNVVLASDFKEVDTTIPVAPVRATLDLFKPTLHIVNVDSEHYVELTDEYKAERKKLENMF